MKVRFNNIQTKFLVVFLSFFLIVFGTLAAVSYYIMQGELLQATQDNAKAISSDYTNQTKTYIKELTIHLENLATIQRIRTGTNKEQMVEAMNELHKRAGVFDTVFFVWPDGSGIRFNGSTAFYGDREYVKKVIDTREAYISDVLVSKAI